MLLGRLPRRRRIFWTFRPRRITSYNVCYTKLLRFGQLLRFEEAAHLGHDDGEFVATEAGDGIDFTGHFAKQRRDLVQQAVTDRMAVSVIDLFEPVEIEEQQGDKVAGTASYNFV